MTVLQDFKGLYVHVYCYQHNDKGRCTLTTANSVMSKKVRQTEKMGRHHQRMDINGVNLLSGKELFIWFTARTFRKLLSINVFSCFPLGFEGRIWDLIVSVPDHCLSFYL